jgi:hypothetical protein
VEEHGGHWYPGDATHGAHWADRVNPLSIDHVDPKRDRLDVANWRVLCMIANSRKGSRPES